MKKKNWRYLKKKVLASATVDAYMPGSIDKIFYKIIECKRDKIDEFIENIKKRRYPVQLTYGDFFVLFAKKVDSNLLSYLPQITVECDVLESSNLQHIFGVDEIVIREDIWPYTTVRKLDYKPTLHGHVSKSSDELVIKGTVLYFKD